MLKKIVLIMFCFLLTGCGSQSIAFDVSTQDRVQITMSSSLFDLKTDKDTFVLYDANQQKVAEGLFIPKETYESLVQEKEKVDILEDSKKKNDPYFLCKVENSYIYVLFLHKSQTGIYLTCQTSQKEAKRLFENLDIKILENS